MAAPGVLGNDTDVDGGPLTRDPVAAAPPGELDAERRRLLHYTPAADYNGADSFTYTASDGGLTATSRRCRSRWHP